MLSGFQAIGVGLGRALRSPLILAGLWLIGLAAALPSTWIVVGAIEDSIGSSRVHESMTRGFDYGWYEEYRASADGLERGFDPALMGAGAFYDNLERWLTGRLFGGDPTLLVVAAVHAAVWLFLLGGVLDRYARPEQAPGVARFFRACTAYFLRLFRLTALSAILYFLVYRLLRVLLERIESATQEGTSESTVITYSLLAWGLVTLLLTLVHMSFGFAKAAAVVEERKSMLLAALRGVGFVVLQPGKAFPLYYGMLLASGLALAVYALVAPGVGQSTPTAVWVAFLAAQAFLLLRILLRLGLLAGQVALFRAAVVLPPQAAPTDVAPEPR